jgi:diguanylate cyclase (GGDEF)-like protein
MRKGHFWVNLICGAVILLFSLLAFFTPFRYVGSVYKESLDADEGWYYMEEDSSGETGNAEKKLTDKKLTDKEASLKDLTFTDGKAVVGRVLSPGGLAGGDLCFISTNIKFMIYMGDDLIYDFDPEMKAYSGETYGNCVHEVNMPYFTEDVVLRIEGEVMGTDMWSGFDRSLFQNSAQYMKDLLSDNFYKLVFSFIIFCSGFILIVLALSFEFRVNKQVEAISIGTVAMTLAVWSNSGTYMLETFCSDLGLVRMMNYGTLMMLPLPGLTLILCATRNLKSKLLLIEDILVIANILIHIVLIGTGVADYHDILIFTHINFVLAVVFGAIEITKGFMKKKIRDKEQFVVLGTFSVVVITGIVDLILYYFGNRKDVSRFTRIGLLLFIIVLSIHEIGQLIEISKKSSEAEIMHKLAHEDGLTKLENRLAFTEYEEELAKRSSGYCLFVQLDVNFLKRVNDGYGHVEGDRIIKGAAMVIRDSFGEEGRVFRTGGDEFIAVIEGGTQMDLIHRYEKIVADLDQRIVDFNVRENPPVNLSIAYGMAEYECGSGNPEQKEKLADARMYEHKKWLKSQQEDLLTKKKELKQEHN